MVTVKMFDTARGLVIFDLERAGPKIQLTIKRGHDRLVYEKIVWEQFIASVEHLYSGVLGKKLIVCESPYLALARELDFGRFDRIKFYCRHPGISCLAFEIDEFSREFLPCLVSNQKKIQKRKKMPCP